MTREQDERLTPEERERFDALPREMTPPAALERRVGDELHRQGLLGGRGRWGWPGMIWTLAPTLAALVVGVFVGMSWQRQVPGPATEMPRYLLILRSGAEFQAETGNENRRGEYAEWAMNGLPRGAFLAGEELSSEGWNLRRADGTVQTEEIGTDAAQEGTVAGFFLIQAESAERAVEIARTTPHLKYGGRVEVRPIESGS